MRRPILILFVLAALGTACGGPAADAPQPSATPSDEVRSKGCPDGPCVEIVSPAWHATIAGASVTLKTRVTNFELVDKIGEKAKKGEGHLVYYRLQSRDAKIPTAKKKTALSGGKGVFTSYPGDETTYTFVNESPNLPSGGYAFEVQLVNNDNTPLDPPQTARVEVSVQKGLATPSPNSDE